MDVTDRTPSLDETGSPGDELTEAEVDAMADEIADGILSEAFTADGCTRRAFARAALAAGASPALATRAELEAADRAAPRNSYL